MTSAALAGAVGVDPKSVERWISQGRVPHPGTRARVAELLGHEETHLWPQLLLESRAASSAQSELVQLWPSRESVPGDVWRSLLTRATTNLDVLAYAGGFLVEVYGLAQEVQRISSAGGQVRILLGDPESDEVQRRAEAEHLPALAARCRSTLEYLSPVRDLPGVEIRLHSTPLYASIYRFDDEMLTNPHTHGAPAKDSPVFHFQHAADAYLFNYYRDAFERVWVGAEPL